MKMAIRGASTSTAVAMAKKVAPWSVRRRQRLSLAGPACATLCIGPRRLAAGNAPHQESGERVHDEGDDKQSQADLHQRAEIKIAGSFAELVGDDAGHGVSRGKQRLGNLGPV